MKRYKVSDKCTISKGREVLEPGREVPAGWLSKDQLESHIAKGHVLEIQEQPEPEAKPEPKQPKGAEKKAKAKESEPEKQSEPESDEPVSFE